MKSELPRILIVGGNSFVGSTLARALSSDFTVFCTHQHDFTPQKGVTYIRHFRIDDPQGCKAIVKTVEPDVVIYCIGSNDLTQTEPDHQLRGVQIAHSTGASNFLAASESTKSKFIYISSDYIFSGVDGNYPEENSAIPASTLGKAKLGAENFIRSRSHDYLIIRSGPLLGRGTLDHPSWVDQLRESILTKKKVKLQSKNIHNPVHIDFLVAVIRQCLKIDLKNVTLHVGGLSRVSVFECAQIVANHLKLDVSLIEPTDANSNAMPSDYSLNMTETLKLVNVEPLLLEQTLELLI